MSETLAVEISTNVSDYPYEKRFPAGLTLGDLKKKIELIVGAAAETISIDLLDSEGKFVAALNDDKRTIKDLGVKDGMRLYANDTSKQNEELKDDSMVEKYEMSDDKYNERADSVRAYKKKLAEEQGLTPPTEDNREREQEQAAEKIKVGSRCEVTIQGKMARRGEVAFIGKTKFKDGIWTGIKYDEPVGKNDGSVAGVRYFACDANYGGFVRPLDVQCGDFPELAIDDMDEI